MAGNDGKRVKKKIKKNLVYISFSSMYSRLSLPAHHVVVVVVGIHVMYKLVSDPVLR